MTEEDRLSRWDIWPLIGHRTERDEDGETLRVETSALAGLFRHRSGGNSRFLPFFRYRSEHDEQASFADSLILISYDSHDDGAEIHVGTPLLFNYSSRSERCRWNVLLGAVHYDASEEQSEFNLLYYLYRQKTVGKDTHVDAFPFVTFDTGEEGSEFSFLWRLFRYERKGDKVGGHFLFIPWGD